jgi:histidinol-phosphate aminotransferase
MGNSVIKLDVVESYDPGRTGGVALSRTVESLTPYQAANRAGSPDPELASRIFKLDWNESTIGPSPRVGEAIQSWMTRDGGLNWYPELGSPSLLEHLAEYTGLRSDRLLATNGSDDALQLICNTYLDPGDRVVVPVPTYQHFVVFAQSRGAKIEAVRTEDPFVADPVAVREAMSPDVRMLYLVSPNNPTGAVFKAEDVASLCADYPETLVVLDEAYFEFSGATGIELVDRFENLIVTRTFSKAFGLAGLRVGYLAASPNVVQGLNRLYNSKSVNTLAQVGAIAALDDLDYLHEFVNEVDASKDLVVDFFESRGIHARATAANFVVVRVGDVADTVDLLIENDVYVRDRSDYPGMDGCIRMTLGTTEQTHHLLERLDPLFA